MRHRGCAVFGDEAFQVQQLVETLDQRCAIPVPPGDGLELFDHVFRETIFDHARGYADGDGVRRNVFGDDRARADDGAGADLFAGNDRDPVAERFIG